MISSSNARSETISLPAELTREAEATARAEDKSLSAVVQEALRGARKSRLIDELRSLQGYWSASAKERRLLTEKDLERYLGE